eukprot:4375000-Prymnesium_polylepis.2
MSSTRTRPLSAPAILGRVACPSWAVEKVACGAHLDGHDDEAAHIWVVHARGQQDVAWPHEGGKARWGGLGVARRRGATPEPTA